MAATIKIKNSSTAGAVPTSGQLVQGELAVNVTDRRIFTENASGTVVELGTPSIDDNGNATAITIDSSENVLIGGTTAINSAAGRGYVLINGSSTALLDFGVAGASKGYLYHTGTDLRLYNNEAGNVSLHTNGQQRVTVDSSGNLGLKVTPSAWNSGYTAIQIGGNGAIAGNTPTGAGSVIGFSYNTYINSAANYAYRISSEEATNYIQQNGAHSWQTAGTGTADANIGFTTAMRLDVDGNLGIGTTSPDSKLDVDTLTNNTAITVHASSSTSAIMEIGVGQNTAGWPSILSTANGLELGTTASVPINFLTNSSVRMLIDSSGNAQHLGAVMKFAPAPASISSAATLTNANIQSQLINTTGTTYTVTMPIGTTLESLAPWTGINVSYDFYIINTASGTITLDATETGVTSVGTMTVTTGVSAQFRIRRTAANTFVVYRLG